ncbi:MAG TPA: carboxymuconolactone decarboxylase family protein [Sphingobium sp.]|uniref:carboxymuconolactone decarboxylase family protein n=1 Tax=Sphingobium sp. TaxID=1912891 RepID=UPI002ED57069
MDGIVITPEIEAREAQVLDGGPRITLIPVEDLPPESESVRDFLKQMAHKRDPDANYEGETPTILPLMMRHPELFRLQANLGVQLLVDGFLPPRIREIAILRVAWLCGAPYEWGEHVGFAKQAGVTGEEIEAIIEGPDAPGWPDFERAILRSVAELRADSMISDATWAVLAETLDERQLIELPVVIGQYQAVAYYQNALRLPLHPGSKGLRTR